MQPQRQIQKRIWLKKDKLYITDIAAVGDFVDFDLNHDGTGVIKKIERRKNYISRKAPRIRGANPGFHWIIPVIDKLFIVGSIHEPDFNNKAIDRFIVTGESSHLQIIVVINKTDLDKDNISKTWQSLYKEIGYKVILSSVVSEEGLKKLRMKLKVIKIFFGDIRVSANHLYSIPSIPN